MRLSCNGCRVLRKGCSDSCSIRPCLQWIKSPDAQSNATVFLAKFYGRAGLLNLINAGGPEQLRPAVFRSLLYEACGRIVNPIYGSVGLLWSGNWHMCQAAVEAVLKGAPIVRISNDDHLIAAAPVHLLHIKAYDIRHVSDGNNKKKKRKSANSSAAATTTCKNNKKPKHRQQDDSVSDHRKQDNDQEEASALSHHHHHHHKHKHNDQDEAEAASHVSQAQAEAEHNQQEHVDEDEQQQQSTHNEQEAAEEEQLGLDLTLGLAPTTAGGDDAGCSSLTGTGWTAAEPGLVGLRFL